MARSGWTRAAAAGTLVVVVAVALRLWMPGPTILTVDELNWTTRSTAFREAWADRDLAAMVAEPEGKPATRPGVVTMWVGTAGQVVADRFDGEDLRRSHQVMGLAVGLLVAPFMLATRRLVGARAALVAGGIVAVEPLLVGHSALLHTDAPLALLAGVSGVGLLAAAEARRGEGDDGVSRPWIRRPSLWWATLAGAAAGGAFLTKLTSVTLLVPAVVAVVAVHLLLRRRRPVASTEEEARPGPTRAAVREVVDVVAPFAAVAVAVVVAVWPALWVAPVSTLRATLDSRRLADNPTPRFFMGEVIGGSDWRYYPVELVHRASPWLAVMVPAAVVWSVLRRSRGAPAALPRRHAAVLLFTALAYLAILVTRDKQYARYLLPLLPLAAVGLGAVASRWWDRAGPRVAAAVATAALVGSSVWTASLAPFALSHANPLAGGQATAADHVPLGWGEGKEQLGPVVELPDPCPRWSGSGAWLGLLVQGCEQVGFEWLDDEAEPPGMVVRYVTDVQAGLEPEGLEEHLRRHGRLLDTVEVQGHTYVEVWLLDRDT